MTLGSRFRPCSRVPKNGKDKRRAEKELLVDRALEWGVGRFLF